MDKITQAYNDNNLLFDLAKIATILGFSKTAISKVLRPTDQTTMSGIVIVDTKLMNLLLFC